MLIGDASRLKMLREAEDSLKLNTSFVELAEPHDFGGRIHQTRWKERLEDHLELLRCHYNFVRPHRALKFVGEVSTPVMQAGLTNRRLALRGVFQSAMVLWVSKRVACGQSTAVVIVNETRMPLAA